MIDFKFAPEGYPFLLGSFLVTLIAALLLFWSWRTGGSAGLVSSLLISFVSCSVSPLLWPIFSEIRKG